MNDCPRQNPAYRSAPTSSDPDARVGWWLDRPTRGRQTCQIPELVPLLPTMPKKRCVLAGEPPTVAVSVGLKPAVFKALPRIEGPG